MIIVQTDEYGNVINKFDKKETEISEQDLRKKGLELSFVKEPGRNNILNIQNGKVIDYETLEEIGSFETKGPTVYVTVGEDKRIYTIEG